MVSGEREAVQGGVNRHVGTVGWQVTVNRRAQAGEGSGAGDLSHQVTGQSEGHQEPPRGALGAHILQGAP